MNTPRRFRTIWISDVHLGTRGAKAEALLEFLRLFESETLYLVGDIVDGWQIRKSWYWPQPHNDVIQKFLRKARKHTRVVYIPGNHDEFARDYLDLDFGGIALRGQVLHTTADGRRLLVLHGDELDLSVRYARWLAMLGGSAYGLALWLNQGVNMIRRWFGYPYWSLAAHLKHKVKKAVQFMSDFEEGITELARKHGADGVVCGHIHKAEIREINGIQYYNDGDWVESCTALVEHHDGHMELLHWPFEATHGPAFIEQIATPAKPPTSPTPVPA